MDKKFQILPVNLLESYLSKFPLSKKQEFEKLEDSELSIESFSFYTSVSVVFSSRIEGELIEMDSFIKHKRFGVKFSPDYTKKMDDLYNAYSFAQKNNLSEENIKQVHAQITKHILHKSRQGKIRITPMFVVTETGKIEYVAVDPQKVEFELKKLFQDIDLLLETNLSFEEVFFYASMIHLVFVKIHPFDDGNGRTARLLEKWFLSEKLGEKAWFMQPERYYYDNHQAYYQNIRKLGLEYEDLNYSEALPFLQMLPNSIDHFA